ncbi:MAG: hypothetical protein RLZZ387_5194 [Chloroflexota bacterium]
MATAAVAVAPVAAAAAVAAVAPVVVAAVAVAPVVAAAVAVAPVAAAAVAVAPVAAAVSAVAPVAPVAPVVVAVVAVVADLVVPEGAVAALPDVTARRRAPRATGHAVVSPRAVDDQAASADETVGVDRTAAARLPCVLLCAPRVRLSCPSA